MEYLKSLLGTHKSNQTPLSFDQDKQLLQPATKAENREKITDSTRHETNLNNSSTQLEPATASERLELIGSNIQEALKRVIPLEDDDCLSCKLIGTSVLWGSSVFILKAGKKVGLKQTGFRRVTLSLSYSSFAFGLFMLGTARLLDLSIFQKGSQKNILQMAQDDLQSIKDFFSEKSDKEK